MTKDSVEKRRITTRLTVEDYNELEQMAEEAGFASVSAMLQYFAQCCVRNHRGTFGVPSGVLALFYDTLAYDRVTIERAISNMRQRERYQQKKREIGDEIGEMFRDYEEEGAQKMFPDDIRKRK